MIPLLIFNCLELLSLNRSLYCKIFCLCQSEIGVVWLKVWIVKENIKITQAGCEVGKFAVLCAGTGMSVIGSWKKRAPGALVILSCCYSLFMSVLQLWLDLSLTVRETIPQLLHLCNHLPFRCCVLVGEKKKTTKCEISIFWTPVWRRRKKFESKEHIF